MSTSEIIENVANDTIGGLKKFNTTATSPRDAFTARIYFSTGEGCEVRISPSFTMKAEEIAAWYFPDCEEEFLKYFSSVSTPSATRFEFVMPNEDANVWPFEEIERYIIDALGRLLENLEDIELGYDDSNLTP